METYFILLDTLSSEYKWPDKNCSEWNWGRINIKNRQKIYSPCPRPETQHNPFNLFFKHRSTPRFTGACNINIDFRNLQHVKVPSCSRHSIPSLTYYKSFHLSSQLEFFWSKSQNLFGCRHRDKTNSSSPDGCKRLRWHNRKRTLYVTGQRQIFGFVNSDGL